MKEKIAIILIVSVIAILAAVILIYQPPQQLVSCFVECKLHYGMLREGFTSFQGDTIFFHLGMEEEVTVVTRSGESVKFFRFSNALSSKWHVVPDLTTEAHGALKRIVKNGRTVYSGFPSEIALRDNFVRTYKMDEQRAIQMASLVTKPVF